jgi:hypothetical protein
MKPRVFSQIWTEIGSTKGQRRWHVEFEDSCGCIVEEDFASFQTAERFAAHIAGGGSRWEFVA